MSESIVAELKNAAKYLQSAVDEEEILSILGILKAKNVTEATLRESKVGLAVGKLRTHKTKSVSDLSKNIVSQWKAAVEKAKTANTPHTGHISFHNAHEAPKKSSTVTATGPASQQNDPRMFTFGPEGGTGDIIRDKCIELIYDGLACKASTASTASTARTAPLAHILVKAHEVEAAAYSSMGGTNTDYKNKIRSMFVKLRNRDNPGLRAMVVDGSISPQRLMRMTSQRKTQTSPH